MKIHRSRQSLLKALALLVLLLTATRGVPYSIQTHEQLIDLAWKQSIRPLLLKRFPTLTEAQVREAHAYAYGGCAIQDFGYYPFGNAFFSDLTHYVRSGDFVLALLRMLRRPTNSPSPSAPSRTTSATPSDIAPPSTMPSPSSFPSSKKNTAPSSTSRKASAPIFRLSSP